MIETDNIYFVLSLKTLNGIFIVQLLSCVWVFAIPRTVKQQASLSITIKTNQSPRRRTQNGPESVQFSQVAKSCPITCDPHGLGHARLPCPSPTPKACSNSSPLSWWYHPTISSSVVPFSSSHQSFPGSGSFPMSQFFASGGQSTGASASASVLSK